MGEGSGWRGELSGEGGAESAGYEKRDCAAAGAEFVDGVL